MIARELSNRAYVEGLRDPQRRMRNRVSVLRQQGHPDSDATAAGLEAALDRINAVWAERETLTEVLADVCPQTQRPRIAA